MKQKQKQKEKLKNELEIQIKQEQTKRKLESQEVKEPGIIDCFYGFPNRPQTPYAVQKSQAKKIQKLMKNILDSQLQER